MKSICLVNGSLRGKKAASSEFLKDVDRRIPDTECTKTFLTVMASIEKNYSEKMLNSLARADAIVFVFPLHNYGLPGALMRLLEEYYQYARSGRQYNQCLRVYAVINCAFPRPGETTGEAVRVLQNFCRRLSMNWRFAVCIGTGPVVVMTKRIPFLYPKLKKAYAEIATDLQSGDNGIRKDYLIKPVIPEAIIARIKRHYEKKGRMIARDE